MGTYMITQWAIKKVLLIIIMVAKSIIIMVVVYDLSSELAFLLNLESLLYFPHVYLNYLFKLCSTFIDWKHIGLWQRWQKMNSQTDIMKFLQSYEILKLKYFKLDYEAHGDVLTL